MKIKKDMPQSEKIISEINYIFNAHYELLLAWTTIGTISQLTIGNDNTLNVKQNNFIEYDNDKYSVYLKNLGQLYWLTIIIENFGLFQKLK